MGSISNDNCCLPDYRHLALRKPLARYLLGIARQLVKVVRLANGSRRSYASCLKKLKSVRIGTGAEYACLRLLKD